MIITATEVTKKFLYAKDINWVDYMDAFTCTFQSQRPLVVEDMVIAFTKSSTKFGRLLMWLRTLFVKPFGLKSVTSNIKKTTSIQRGEKIGLFKIINVAENEIVTGEEDKHLDYWVSFYLDCADEKKGTYQFTLSTSVLLHNFWGRLYFFPVKFLHKIIVPLMMKKMILKLKRDWQ
ncbi:MAG: DUF2867 domain-containing protein [Chitinophagaceae bacterium]|nr:DUF2867 domain-containing protein [Chitinophagaceae bacterium]